MGRGNQLVYGKVQLASENSTMEDLIEVLDKILKSHRYPESAPSEEVKVTLEKKGEKEAARDDELDDLKQELSKIDEDG